MGLATPDAPFGPDGILDAEAPDAEQAFDLPPPAFDLADDVALDLGLDAPGEVASDLGADLAPDAPPAADAPPDGSVDAANVDVAGDTAPLTVDLPVTEDADLDSTIPSRNNGSLDTMLVDGASTPATSVWRADLSTVPASATVLSAELHITTSNDTGDPCTLFEVLESWSEASVTWNRRSTGMTWMGAGATPPSRGVVGIGGPIDTSTALTTRVVPLSLAVVAKWVATPAVNFGAAIVMTTAGGATFRTRNDTVAARRPFVRLTYQP
jgi:hypothetical protein